MAVMSRVLIVNPFATGVTERRLADVQKALPVGTETVLTQARGDATSLAAEWSPRADAIYVFSGDGTYNEVINGITSDVPIGFIPGGGTSVLPRALGLPRDPARAAERLAHGKLRRISVGRANGRRFAFNAGVGFDVARTSRRRARAQGRWQAAGRHRFRLDGCSDARRPPASLRACNRDRGPRAGRLCTDRELFTVYLRWAPRTADRPRRDVRGRSRHHRPDRSTRPLAPASRRAGATRPPRWGACSRRPRPRSDHDSL